MSAAPTEVAVRRPGARRMGFFTDTTVCIGCKACEVACKQWNDLPADGSVFRRKASYDHTGALSASTWRHVRFVEQTEPVGLPDLPAYGRGGLDGRGEVDLVAAASPPAPSHDDVDLVAAAEGLSADVPQLDRWLFVSDVCKHCTNAGCLDACPTGALIRTEFETVIVQPDVCNGCGYCVPSCPFGVIDRDPYDGRAAKCTLCYDRLQDGLEPACAKSCPTDSIQFGPYDELVETARGRVLALHERGMTGAYLYGAGDEPGEQLAGELGAFFLLTAPPERFGLPAQAESPAQENGPVATAAGLAAAFAGVAAAVLSFSRAHRAAPGRSATARFAPARSARSSPARSARTLRALRGRR